MSTPIQINTSETEENYTRIAHQTSQQLQVNIPSDTESCYEYISPLSQSILLSAPQIQSDADESMTLDANELLVATTLPDLSIEVLPSDLYSTNSQTYEDFLDSGDIFSLISEFSNEEEEEEKEDDDEEENTDNFIKIATRVFESDQQPGNLPCLNELVSDNSGLRNDIPIYTRSISLPSTINLNPKPIDVFPKSPNYDFLSTNTQINLLQKLIHGKEVADSSKIPTVSESVESQLSSFRNVKGSRTVTSSECSGDVDECPDAVPDSLLFNTPTFRNEKSYRTATITSSECSRDVEEPDGGYSDTIKLIAPSFRSIESSRTATATSSECRKDNDESTAEIFHTFKFKLPSFHRVKRYRKPSVTSSESSVDESSDEAKSDLDELHTAVQQSVLQGSVMPILKKELQTKVQYERLLRGDSELVLEEESPKQYKLRQDEIDKKERRLSQNRESARRCRVRTKSYEHSLKKVVKEEMNRQAKLRQELDHLKKEQGALKKILENHSDCVFHAK